MHAERLLWSIRVPSLVLIAQAIFLLERGQTGRQTDATERPTLASMPAWVTKHTPVSLNQLSMLKFFESQLSIKLFSLLS